MIRSQIPQEDPLTGVRRVCGFLGRTAGLYLFGFSLMPFQAKTTVDDLSTDDGNLFPAPGRGARFAS
jgi:hypothetical protein